MATHRRTSAMNHHKNNLEQDQVYLDLKNRVLNARYEVTKDYPATVTNHQLQVQIVQALHQYLDENYNKNISKSDFIGIIQLLEKSIRRRASELYLHLDNSKAGLQ